MSLIIDGIEALQCENVAIDVWHSKINYSDAYLIYSIFIALRGHELNLPYVGSQEYDELVGAGKLVSN